MTWDRLVQQFGKYCSIRHMEHKELPTGKFGRMESPHWIFWELKLKASNAQLSLHQPWRDILLDYKIIMFSTYKQLNFLVNTNQLYMLLILKKESLSQLSSTPE